MPQNNPDHPTDGRIYREINYYKVLELPENAQDLSLIKQHYIRLARLHHPDKLGHPASAEENQRFIDIQDAYEILKDPIKRAAYNRYAEANRLGIDEELDTENTYETTPEPSITPSHAVHRTTDPRNLTELIQKIKRAALMNELLYLQELLLEYNSLQIPVQIRAEHIKEFNWLLRHTASIKANAVAKIMLEFGAELNHYAEIIRHDGKDTFKCYFVDMLMYYDNFSLFFELAPQIDLTVYKVTYIEEENINNAKINLTGFTMRQLLEHQKDNSKHIDSAQIYYLNRATRLLMLSMFCYWVLNNNAKHVLISLKSICQTIDWSRLPDSNQALESQKSIIESIILARPLTSVLLVDQYQRAENTRYVWQYSYALQNVINSLMASGVLLLGKNRVNIQDALQSFSILLESDISQSHRIYARVKWLRDHEWKIRLSAAASLILGAVLVIAGAAIKNDDPSQQYVSILGAAIWAPYFLLAGPAMLFSLLHFASFGLYDAYQSIEDIVISTHTSALQYNIAKRNAVAPCQGLFFMCHKPKKTMIQNQGTDPEAGQERHNRLALA